MFTVGEPLSAQRSQICCSSRSAAWSVSAPSSCTNRASSAGSVREAARSPAPQAASARAAKAKVKARIAVSVLTLHEIHRARERFRELLGLFEPELGPNSAL